MSRFCTVELRGEEMDVEIVHDGGYEHDTGAHEIDWHFVGLTADQVYQRRRVWEQFGDVYQNYPHLHWSHFFAALTWVDDWVECLTWANDINATAAEMRAWRRAQRGEDLSDASEERQAGKTLFHD